MAIIASLRRSGPWPNGVSVEWTRKVTCKLTFEFSLPSLGEQNPFFFEGMEEERDG